MSKYTYKSILPK